MVVFHDIGFDRLVNSYRNPAVVNRTVQYMSCPGTMRTMDLDNITNSVVVTTGGSLTFRKLIIQVCAMTRDSKAERAAATSHHVRQWQPSTAFTALLTHAACQLPRTVCQFNKLLF